MTEEQKAEARALRDAERAIKRTLCGDPEYDASYNAMLVRTAKVWAQEQGCATDRGWVVFHFGEPSGWISALDNPRSWVPGVRAVPLAEGEREYFAEGGDEEAGAVQWSAALKPSGPAATDAEGEVIFRMTAAMREADLHFETVGGGTRHFVRECLLPILADHGLALKLTVPTKGTTDSV